MHPFYLRNMYIRNLLAKPGALELAGERMDLSKVDTPAYFISAVEDHIAPWKSTYAGARLLGGPVRFVLGGSGHIAGIVNPPVANKYNYWLNDALPESADEWLSGATRHDGSWWTDWAAWVHRFSGGRVDARRPGDGGLKVLDDAPGSYAKLRLGAGEQGAKCAPVTAGAATAPAAPVAALPAGPMPPATARAPAKKVAGKSPKPTAPAKEPAAGKKQGKQGPPSKKVAAAAGSGIEPVRSEKPAKKKAARQGAKLKLMPGSQTPAAAISALFKAQQAPAKPPAEKTPAAKPRAAAKPRGARRGAGFRD
jgi:hypothetical protein